MVNSNNINGTRLGLEIAERHDGEGIQTIEGRGISSNSHSAFMGNDSSPENPRSSRINGNTRTTYNYVNMIVECILRSPSKRVLLCDIYKHVQKYYKEMIEKGVDWQNGIRHNLSLNDCFVKDGRNPNGKGYYWTIAEKNLPYFENGDFRRRWSQCRTRRQRDVTEVRRHQGYANNNLAHNSNLSPYSSSNSSQSYLAYSNGITMANDTNSYERARMFFPHDLLPYNASYVSSYNHQPNNFHYSSMSSYYNRPHFPSHHEIQPPVPAPIYYPFSFYNDPYMHSSYHTPNHNIMTSMNTDQANYEDQSKLDEINKMRSQSCQDYRMDSIINRY